MLEVEPEAADVVPEEEAPPPGFEGEGPPLMLVQSSEP